MMKKRYKYLMLLMSVVLLAGCMDDEDKIYSNHCYITGVTLGSVRRQMHTKTSSGSDSIYYTTFTGNNFPMTIDQRNLLIENKDSLLCGAQLGALTMTITYVGSTVAYRPASDPDGEWMAYKSSDSLDVREPLHLLLLSEDGNSFRTYTLRVNVHQQEGDSLYWSRVDSTAIFDGMTQMRAVVLNDRLMVLGKRGGSVTRAIRSTLGRVGEWTAETTDLPANADVEGIIQRGNSLYATTDDGTLYTSSDGNHWTVAASPIANLRLAAVTDSSFYAILNGRLCRSTDGADWTEETIDDSLDCLPTNSLRSYSIVQDNGNERLILLGYRSAAGNDSTAVVWSKMWNRYTPESEAEWTYINATHDNIYLCPRLEHLNLFAYDGRGLVVGGGSEEGHGHRAALDGMYFSNDYGITWKRDYELHLPAAARGAAGPVAATVDGDNYIWLIASNQVWRGRLNRLGFARQ
ncbi:MAG: DUF6242 domain-containing protein [Bacteroidaceae bacterium]|nr:DUF6242 domain-containing protein [Bacteroidaceae bacterium]